MKRDRHNHPEMQGPADSPEMPIPDETNALDADVREVDRLIAETLRYERTAYWSAERQRRVFVASAARLAGGASEAGKANDTADMTDAAASDSSGPHLVRSAADAPLTTGVQPTPERRRAHEADRRLSWPMVAGVAAVALLAITLSMIFSSALRPVAPDEFAGRDDATESSRIEDPVPGEAGSPGNAVDADAAPSYAADAEGFAEPVLDPQIESLERDLSELENEIMHAWLTESPSLLARTSDIDHWMNDLEAELEAF